MKLFSETDAHINELVREQVACVGSGNFHTCGNHQRDWLPADFQLPARQRIMDSGIEFTSHYTHSSPCSPSRATLFTGEYMAGHGVTENSSAPTNTQLSKDAATLGKILREKGYYTAYKLSSSSDS